MAVPPSYGSVPIRNRIDYGYVPVTGHVQAPAPSPAPRPYTPPPSYSPYVSSPSYHGPYRHPAAPAPAPRPYTPPGALNIRQNPVQSFHPQAQFKATARRLGTQAMQAELRQPGVAAQFATPRTIPRNLHGAAQIYAALGEASRLRTQFFGNRLPTRAAEAAWSNMLTNAHPQFTQLISHALHEANRMGGLNRPFMASTSGPRGEEGAGINPIDAAIKAYDPLGAGNVQQAREANAFQEQGIAELAAERQRRLEHAGDVQLAGATINPLHVEQGFATAFQNMPSVAGAIASILPKSAPTSALKDVANIGQRITGEALDLPGQLSLAAYLGGAHIGAGIETGKWGGAERFGKQVGKSLIEPYTHPVKSLKQSPLSTILAFGGPEAAAGTAIGELGRAGIAGSRVARAFSRALPDIATYGERQLVPKGEGQGFVHGQMAGELAEQAAKARGAGSEQAAKARLEGIRIGAQEAGVPRKAPRDIFRSLVQQGLERRKYGEPVVLREGEKPVYQASPAQAQRLVSGGRAFKVGVVDLQKSAENRLRVSKVRGTVNAVMEKLAEKGGQAVGVRPKRGADAVQMIAENNLTPATWDAKLASELERYRRMAKAKDDAGNPVLTGPDRVANKQQVKLLEGLKEDKKLAAQVKEKGWGAEPFVSAQRIKRIQGTLANRLIMGGKLAPEQVRAAYFSHAISDMGAKYHTIEDHVAAEEREIAKGATQERIDQVSGREPTKVAANREAKRQLDVAQATHDARLKTLADVEKNRGKVVAVQQSRRSREGNRASTAGERDTMNGWNERLGTAEQSVRDAKAALKEHQQKYDENPMPKREAGLRGPHGEYLATDTILNHMLEQGKEGAKIVALRELARRSENPNEAALAARRARELMIKHGNTEPAYFSHVRGVAGRQSFYRAIARQPALEAFARTGEAHLKGLNDKSWEAVVGSLAKQASEVAQLEGRRMFLNRFAIDRYKTARDAHLANDQFEASKEGQDILAKGGTRNVVIHYGSGQIVDSPDFKAKVEPGDAESFLKQQGLDQYRDPTSAEYGRFGLMPEHVWKRYAAHDKAVSVEGVAPDVVRDLQAYAKAWRRAKLNLSMPHIFGVMQEQAIRLLAEQAGPGSWWVGRKVDRKALKPLAEVDSHGYMADSQGPLGEDYRYQEAVMGGRGGFASSGEWNDIVRKGEQWQQGATEGRLLRAGERTLRSVPGRAIYGAWRAWSNAIEGGLLRSVEHATNHALTGKALRESGVIDNFRSVLKMQDDAVKKLIEDRLTPNAADEVARKVLDMQGNWTAQTPLVRSIVSRYTPFGLWLLNSYRWLYRLPLTHPVKTAVLAGIYKVTARERAEKGQGESAYSRELMRGMGKAPVPAFLQGGWPVNLPLVGKTKMMPSYYSPMGALGAEAGQTFVEQFLPFFTGPLSALQGVNPLTHEPLKAPGETGKEEKIGVGQMLENAAAEAVAGPIPGATQLEKATLKGGKPYGTSNLFTDIASLLGGKKQAKPGTERSWEETIGKMIEPTRVIREKATGAGSEGAPTTGAGKAQVRQLIREARQARAGAAAQAERKETRELIRQERRERGG